MAFSKLDVAPWAATLLENGIRGRHMGHWKYISTEYTCMYSVQRTKQARGGGC